VSTLRPAFFDSCGLAALSLAFACGGISDPTRGPEHVATVTGALTGSAAPSGAHVALVWRKGQSGGYAVAADAPVVDGHFTLGLDVPPDAYFSNVDPSDGPPNITPPSGDGSGPSTGSGSGGVSGGGSGGVSTADAGTSGSQSIHPNDTAGGQITGPLTAAIAGFVVYVDANGNGVLDLTGDTASSPDQLVGGAEELLLVYLRGGGSLDYEKLRDKSGILPVQGFDLAWSKGRWLPLDEVELKITSTMPHLPYAVCGSSTTVSDVSFGSGSSGFSTDTPSARPEQIVCSPDGRSYHYDCPSSPPPPPPGLCMSDVLVGVTCGGGGSSLAPGEPIPPGWPCPVAGSGGADDAGVLTFDASVPHSDAGTSCATQCNSDSDCQSTCPAHAFDSACCDLATRVCFFASGPVCPGAFDAGAGG
jgi:hypothetical protein